MAKFKTQDVRKIGPKEESLKVGDTVQVFEDPITEKKSEGVAIIRKVGGEELASWYGGDTGYKSCEVEFYVGNGVNNGRELEGMRVPRIVHIRNKVKPVK